MTSVAPLPGDRELGQSGSWQFMTGLISLLEPDELLQRFFQLLRQHVACDAFAYRYDASSLEIRFGIVGRCHAEYHLRLGEVSLGYIGFSRRRRFSEADLELIERALGLLLHPLRNALRYREACLEARRDPLTGVLNRGAMDEVLQRQLLLAERHGEPFSLLILDLDNFKQINDRYGHAKGDEVLRRVAGILQAVCRGSDPVFRYAGDEFVVAMHRADHEGGRCMAERLRHAVDQEDFGLPDDGPGVAMSIGIATRKADDTPDSLLQRADRGLYKAKAGGRNRTQALN